MIIKLEPHGFVIFLTLAMGMVYAISNSRNGWGFWKVACTAVFVLPTLYYGFMVGRVVEVVLGAAIGWIYGRGGISFRLFGWIGDWHYNRRLRRDNRQKSKQKKREQTRSEKQRKSSHDDEVKKRREQAKAKRDSSQKHNDEQSPYKEHNHNSNFNSNQEEVENKTEEKLDGALDPTNIKDAFDVLGLDKGADYEQAKRAYRILISIYNSDKIASLSGRRKLQAEEEAKDINLAWSTLKATYRNGK